MNDYIRYYESTNRKGQKVVVAKLGNMYEQMSKMLDNTIPVYSFCCSDAYMAKATCSVDDKYDIDFGAELAKVRLLKKVYGARITEIDCYIDYMRTVIDTLMAKRDKFTDAYRDYAERDNVMSKTGNYSEK